MGYILNTSVGSMREVLALLDPGASPDELAFLRKRARDLDVRRREWGESEDGERPVAEAVEDILAGRDKDPRSGVSYALAFREMTRALFFDGPDLGPFSRPSAAFGGLGDELGRLGVPAPLWPVSFVYARVPHGLDLPGHEWPVLGWLPIERAAPLAAAYTAVLDRLDPDYQDMAEQLVDLARFATTVPVATGILTHLT